MNGPMSVQSKLTVRARAAWFHIEPPNSYCASIL
jgi:hypothetical protein